MATKPLEPPRFMVPLVKSTGFMDDAWAKWVRDLDQKIRELEARIKALETEVTTLSGGTWP